MHFLLLLKTDILDILNNNNNNNKRMEARLLIATQVGKCNIPTKYFHINERLA
jgi:hypothetical protein